MTTATVEARDLALQALYEVEQGPKVEGTPEEVADRLLAQVVTTDDLDPATVPTHVLDKARRLVAGVLAHRPELDEAIQAVSPRWRLERMPVVDRNVLRLGLYELRYEDEPVGVVVNEAVRLAKTYSTERSGRFVNGVLGELARRERGSDRRRDDR